MSEAVEFLQALAQALAVVALYPPNHATRRHALDHAYQRLLDLFVVDKRPRGRSRIRETTAQGAARLGVG